MPRELPQPAGVEAAVELRARVAGLRLGRALVGAFGLVVVPLLLVGDELDRDEEDEEARDGGVDDGYAGVDAGGEEEEVGGGRDGEEEDLANVLAAGMTSWSQGGRLTLCTDEVNRMFSRKKAGVPIQPLIKFQR